MGIFARRKTSDNAIRAASWRMCKREEVGKKLALREFHFGTIAESSRGGITFIINYFWKISSQ